MPSTHHAVSEATKMDSFETTDPSTADELRMLGTVQPSGEVITIDPSLLYLTDAERAEIEAFRLLVEDIHQQSQKRKLARAFPILDLPPETRLRIYEYVFQQESDAGRVLAVTVTPRVAQVCKTFRTEALPLFFAETKFIIPIGSNIEHRAHCRKGHTLNWRYYRSYTQQCGVMNFKRPVKKALREAGDNAIFRNVVFQVFEIQFVSSKQGEEVPDHSGVIDIKLSVHCGRLLVDAIEKDCHPASMTYRVDRVAESEDVDVVVNEIRRIAADVSSDAGFNGLKLRDLERMAKVFRFTEPAT